MTRTTQSGPTSRPGTRDRIVDAALSCFSRHGYEVAVDVIAAEAEVSKITLYKHFGEKRELFIQVVSIALRRQLDSFLPDLERLSHNPRDVRENLIRLADTVSRSIRSPQQARIETIVRYQSAEFPELAREWQRCGPEPGRRALAAVFEELVRTGALCIPDIPLAVTHFSGLILGTLMEFIDPALPSLEERQRTIETGVDVFLHYYGADTHPGRTAQAVTSATPGERA